MTLLVRDEEDVLSENIEYHLSQGVDYIIATDNKSVDSTAQILKRYERMGVLKYIYEEEDDYSQYKWVTRMARMAKDEYAADWVINNDADEFWWPTEGNLRGVFKQVLNEYDVLKVSRSDFVLVATDGRPFYKRMVYRERCSLNAIGKPLPPKVAHRGCSGVEVAQGNHSVSGMPKGKVAEGGVTIFHFPIRSYQQIVNKIVKGGEAYEKNKDLSERIGITWRNLYKEYKENNNLLRYHGRQLNSPWLVRDKLKSGSLILDRRLSDYMSHLQSV